MKKSSDKLNLISLIIIQASNAVVPLILFPYVLKVLGSNAYAQIVTAEAIMFIIYAFSLYSFEINGVSEVVKLQNKTDMTALSKLFINIFMIRALILLSAAICIFLLYLLLHWSSIMLLLLWLLYPLSFIFQSTYFYQGMEQNSILALLVLLSRILTLGSLYVLLNQDSSVYMVPLLIGGWYLAGGMVSFIYIWKHFHIHTGLIDTTYMKHLLTEGKEIFFGNISVILFRGSNILLLELFTHNALAVSTYSIAEKFIKSLQAVMRPLNQFFFPKAIKFLQGKTYPDKSSFFQLFKLSLPQLLALGLIIILLSFIYLYKDYIGVLSTYPHIEHIATLITIMLPAVFVGILNFMLGSVGLNHLGFKKYYAKAIFGTGILSMGLTSILIFYAADIGAALGFIAAECLLFVLICYGYFRTRERS